MTSAGVRVHPRRFPARIATTFQVERLLPKSPPTPRNGRVQLLAGGIGNRRSGRPAGRPTRAHQAADSPANRLAWRMRLARAHCELRLMRSSHRASAAIRASPLDGRIRSGGRRSTRSNPRYARGGWSHCCSCRSALGGSLRPTKHSTSASSAQELRPESTGYETRTLRRTKATLAWPRVNAERPG